MEIWKPILGFEGKYVISSHGNVRGLDRIINGGNQWCHYRKFIKGKRLKYVIHQNGYARVELCGKLYSVHRLVCSSFIVNIKDNKEVNHINGIRHDNRVENLEWCTHSENIKHADSSGLRMYGCKKRAVLCTETGREYESISDAGRKLGINIQVLSVMLNGTAKNRTTLVFK